MKQIFTLLAFMVVALLISGAAQAASITYSRVDVVSNYQNLAGTVWKVDWVATTETESIVGYIDADSIEDEGQKADYNLKIESDPIENYVEWSIDPQTSWKVRKLQVQHFHPLVWDVENVVNTCEASNKYLGVFIRPYIWDLDVYCVFESGAYASVGVIRDADKTYFSTKFRVESVMPSQQCYDFGGKYSSGVCYFENTITNKAGDIKAGTHSKIADIAWIYWKGNLMGSRTWINPDSNVEIMVYTNDGWAIRDATKWDTFKTVYDNYATNCPSTPCWGLPQYILTCGNNWINYNSQTTPEECAGTFNRNADEVIYRNVGDSNFIAQNPSFVDRMKENGAKLTAQMGHQFMYPDFSLYVKADWIGISKPVGEPQIVSLSSPPFTEPDGNIIGTFRNKGNYDGSFSINVNCPAPFQVDEIQDMFLTAGESDDLIIPIHATTDLAEVSKTCTVYMSETTSGAIVLQTVTVKVKNKPTCDVGDEWCGPDNNIWYCSPAGLEDMKENCVSQGKRCFYKLDGPKCDFGYGCERDEECDDNNPDTEDRCIHNLCQNTPIRDCSTPGLQRCNELLIDECGMDLKWTNVADCDDGNPFTSDECTVSTLPNKRACKHTQQIPWDYVLYIVIAVLAAAVVIAFILKRK